VIPRKALLPPKLALPNELREQQAGESDDAYAKRIIAWINHAPSRGDLAGWTGSPKFSLSPDDYRRDTKRKR
jgi:hypothetical protein